MTHIEQTIDTADDIHKLFYMLSIERIRQTEKLCQLSTNSKRQ